MAHTNKEQKKKEPQTVQPKHAVNQKNKWLLPVVITISAAVLVIVLLIINGAGIGGDKTEASKNNTQSQASNSDIVIPVSEISSTAKFYPMEIDGTRLEVLAVKAPDGTIRTAFNTCQICYDSGNGYYVQEGSVLVCQNCGNRFPMSQVEVVSGGCNPVPIFAQNKTIDDVNITIPYDYLLQAKSIFANWKTEY